MITKRISLYLLHQPKYNRLTPSTYISFLHGQPSLLFSSNSYNSIPQNTYSNSSNNEKTSSELLPFSPPHSIRSQTKDAIEVQQVVKKGSSFAIKTLKRSPTSPTWTITRHTTSTLSSTSTSSSSSSSSFSSQLFSLSPSSKLSRLINNTSTAFLPKDYTESVTSNYLSYTLWSVSSSVSGTITGVLSTQALLQALGMGVTSGAAIAGTVNWIIKDGFGLLGGVIYAAKIGDKLDSRPKRHRMIASLALQFSTFAELMTPFVPSLFLMIASLSNIGKNVSWLALSATKAAIHRGFCNRDNLGDVTAKAGAQNTAASLLGTGIGIGVSLLSGGSISSLMTIWCGFSSMTLFTVYMSNNQVVTKGWNRERGEMALYPLLNHLVHNIFTMNLDELKTKPNFMNDIMKYLESPEQVASRETFISAYQSPFEIKLRIEPNLEDVLMSITPSQTKDWLQGKIIFTGFDLAHPPSSSPSSSSSSSSSSSLSSSPHLPKEESIRYPDKTIDKTAIQSMYHLTVNIPPNTPLSSTSTSTSSSSSSLIKVTLSYSHEADTKDLIKGFYHACILRHYIQNELKENRIHWQDVHNSLSDLSNFTYHIVDLTFDSMFNQMKQLGWGTDDCYLSERGIRVRACNI